MSEPDTAPAAGSDDASGDVSPPETKRPADSPGDPAPPPAGQAPETDPAGQPVTPESESAGRDTPVEAPLAPLAEDDPLLRGDSGATIRIHCVRDVRCLWAGTAMPDPEQHPNPAAEVRETAGCLADPPTCPCATDGDTPPDLTRIALDAVTPPNVAIEDLAAMRTPLAAPSPFELAAMTTGATVSDSAAPLTLMTAEAHGIVGNDRPVAAPFALGGDVAGVLEALGYDAAAVETVAVTRDDTGEVVVPDGDAGAPDGADSTDDSG